jgi:hypothetical protein
MQQRVCAESTCLNSSTVPALRLTAMIQHLDATHLAEHTTDDCAARFAARRIARSQGWHLLHQRISVLNSTSRPDLHGTRRRMQHNAPSHRRRRVDDHVLSTEAQTATLETLPRCRRSPPNRLWGTCKAQATLSHTHILCRARSILGSHDCTVACG